MREGLKKISAMILLLTFVIALIPSAFAYSQIANGSSGSDVKTMQTMLNTVMNAGLTVDGICGPKSVEAIKNFQKAYGLTADGICGKQTWAKLEAAYNAKKVCTSHIKGSYLWPEEVHPHKKYWKCANCGATFTDGSTTALSSCATCNPPASTSRATISNGSSGSDVKIMQTMLNAVMNAGLTVDGICGPKSVEAIKKFQKAVGLTADGICGRQTWERLEKAYKNGEKITVACTNHTKGSYLWPEAVHPHKKYWKCANCGATFTDGSTTTLDSCTTCKPKEPAATVLADKIVKTAEGLVDKYPYVWGGESPEEGGFDCTGLVYYVYKTCCGVNMTLSQARSKSGLLAMGTKITNKNDFRPGDIVQFTHSHVAIYVGNGMIVEAPSSGKNIRKRSIASDTKIAYAVRLPGITGSGATGAGVQTPAASTTRATIRNGSSGSDVKTLQTMLNKVMNAELAVDGICGAKTVAAIRTFQSESKIAVDGVCGPATWEKLQAAYDGGKVVNPPASSIKIGSGKYNPVELKRGQTYSINGLITSTYRLTNVTVGVYNEDGSKTKWVKSVSPNTTTYDIKKLDSDIKFGELDGTENGKVYYFRVTAIDIEGKNVVLVNNKFKVIKKNCKYQWPLPGNSTITSRFGYRIHPIDKEWKGHGGIDIGAAMGTKVNAAEAGTVYVMYTSCTHNYAGSCGCGGGYGNYLYIVHDDGMRTFYAHLTSVLVSNGSRVSKGTAIGTIGSTGNSTGPHLHFEMRTGSAQSTRVDPLEYTSPY